MPWNMTQLRQITVELKLWIDSKPKHYQLKYTQDVETSHSVSLYINVENNVVPLYMICVLLMLVLDGLISDEYWENS